MKWLKHKQGHFTENPAHRKSLNKNCKKSVLQIHFIFYHELGMITIYLSERNEKKKCGSFIFYIRFSKFD